jgi:hypothetical protein
MRCSGMALRVQSSDLSESIGQRVTVSSLTAYAKRRAPHGARCTTVREFKPMRPNIAVLSEKGDVNGPEPISRVDLLP